MNRKDTIIIAVLINAGLLILLFVTALKPEPAVEKQPIVRQEIEVPAPKLQKRELPKKVEAPKEAPVVAAKPAAPKPAPVVEKKASEPKKLQTVIVQAGDALEKIARRQGVSVASLIEANGLKSTALKVGQELVIPEEGKALAPKKAPKYYQVCAGDSPWTIASKNKINLDKLLSLNDLDEASAKKIKPGDKLRIE